MAPNRAGPFSCPDPAYHAARSTPRAALEGVGLVGKCCPHTNQDEQMNKPQNVPPQRVATRYLDVNVSLVAHDGIFDGEQAPARLYQML